MPVPQGAWMLVWDHRSSNTGPALPLAMLAPARGTAAGDASVGSLCPFTRPSREQRGWVSPPKVTS